MVDARIALDAMGGDQAPGETVRGALQAIEADELAGVILVGDEERILAELPQGKDSLGDRLSVVPASQLVGPGESGRDSLRKRDSSILKGTALVRSGDAHGIVAAGNTAAAVAAATVILKPLPGVRRAGIAVTLPTSDGRTILCDAGSNIHCKPLHLFHYAVMASEYARLILGEENPTVGLLNIGTEIGKGTDLVKETAELFAGTDLNFIGNVEGNDVFTGRCDVVVCEGFAGNVVLKTAEGLYEVISARLRDLAQAVEADGNVPSGESPVRAALSRFRSNMDWAEHGGAPLLGLNGLVLISHGRSDARAICNAILQAVNLHRKRVLSAMESNLVAGASRSAP